MKIQTMIVLIALVCPVKGDTSEPYANDDLQREESLQTIEEGLHEDEVAHGDVAAFQRLTERSKHLRPHPHFDRPLGIIQQSIRRDYGDAGAGAGSDPDTHRSQETSQGESMRRYSTIVPTSLFDRDAYLRAHVQGLIEDEERFGRANRACRWCNITWNGLGGATTATSLVVSAIGACEYMDPRLANIVTIALGVFSGACIWAGTQAKKISHQYHEQQNDIQRSLGVPASLADREVRIDMDQLNARGGAETAHAPAAH